MGERRGTHCSWESPMIGEKFSGAGWPCKSQGWEQEKKSWPTPSHHMFATRETPLHWALPWPWEIISIWKPGWVTGRQDAISPVCIWPGLSSLHSDPYETLLPKNILMDATLVNQKPAVLIPFQCTQLDIKVTVECSLWFASVRMTGFGKLWACDQDSSKVQRFGR